MDQVNQIASTATEETTEKVVVKIDDAITLMRNISGDAHDAENRLKRFRDETRGTIHPWTYPSIENAIGALQAAQSHLRAVVQHLETPEVVAGQVDQKFTI